jgi:hypothetical protein
MSTRRSAVVWLLGLGALAASGCAADAGRRAATRPAGLVYVGTERGIAAFEASSGTTQWTRVGVLPAPNLARLFAVAPPDRSPALVSLDPSTGAPLGALDIPAGFSPRVASPSGLAVALLRGPSAGAPYLPRTRARTRIVVARPDRGEVRTYDLTGTFEPEAFSTDDRKLFLIEYLSPNLGRYRVRMMRLRDGKVLAVGRLTKFAPDSMRGTGREQVYSPSGDVLYTLYTKQPPNSAHRSLEQIHHQGMVHAFIHVLNLREGWAHCIDLPMPFGRGSTPASTLAVSPYGRFLYAGDGRRLATVDVQRLRVMRIEPVNLSAASGGAVVGADEHLYVGSGSSVEVFDGPRLEPLGDLPVSSPIGALGVSADGERLYVGDAHRVAVVDSDSGRVLGSMAASGARAIFYRESPSS